MTTLPINEVSLSSEQYEQMTNQFTLLLEKSGVAMMHHLNPRSSWIAVRNLEELINVSIYLGSHDVLFGGNIFNYNYVHNCLEIIVYNYAPIPNPIKEYRLVFATGGIDDPQQADLVQQFIRDNADRWESSFGSITGFFSDCDRLRQLCFVIMGTISRVDLSGFTIHVPQY